MNTAPVAQADQVEPKRTEATARWRKLLDDQQSSGLPVSAFCRERGIPASSLFAWRRRLAGAAGFKPVKLIAQAERAQGAVRASPSAADADRAWPCAADTTIEVCLRGARRLIVHRGFDRQLLLEVIDALEGEPARLESLA